VIIPGETLRLPVLLPEGYRRYVNPCFGFSVIYPQDWAPAAEYARPDSTMFQPANRQAFLWAFGAILRPGTSVTKEHEWALSMVDGVIDYDRLNPDGYELVVKHEDRLTVIKAIFGCTRRADLIFSYPEKERQYYESILVQVTRSFLPGNLNERHNAEAVHGAIAHKERLN
jgi:hypothetical protein